MSAVGAYGGYRRRVRFKRPNDLVLAVSSVVLGAMVIFVVFGSVIAPQSPSAVNLEIALQGPSLAHLFGTDATGRDIFSRVLAGARPSILGPILIAGGATALGTLIGVVAAWKRGVSDALLSRSMEILFAFPGLLLAMMAVAILGRGLTAPVVALAIANTPWVARIIRSAALRERSLPYIAASSVQGFSGLAICIRHVLPNISRTIWAQLALTFTYGMTDLLAINFLGLGVQPPTPDWGVLVNEGQNSILQNAPWETLFASVFIVLTIVAATALSARLGDEPTAGRGRA
ncbi:MAG: ABC transporter permease [Solirubrobacteraceae bacterium]|jgi:peptide/nickel transport system permease protein